MNKDREKLNIVVVGSGMYTCGRGTDGYGTIMPSIFEWRKHNDVGQVCLAGNSAEGVRAARAKIRELKRRMGADVSVLYCPRGRSDPRCYVEAMRSVLRPACAIVAVPDNLHMEVAKTAISEGLHTLVVKPLSPLVKEALGLIDLQRKKGVYCAVEFHKRFDHANLMLKDTIEQGLIGNPLYFLVEFSQRKEIPAKMFKKWVFTTNVFQYLGVHYVDIIYFVTGAVPIRAMAIGRKNWLRSKGIDTYDSIEGVIEWEAPSNKKFSSHILTSWIDPENTSAMSDQKIKVIGTKGRFESDQKRRGVMMVTDEGGIKEPNPYFCAPYGPEGAVKYRGYGIDNICRFLDDAADVESGNVTIGDLEKKRPTFRQAIASTAALEAVNESLQKGGLWVRIKRSHI